MAIESGFIIEVLESHIDENKKLVVDDYRLLSWDGVTYYDESGQLLDNYKPVGH